MKHETIWLQYQGHDSDDPECDDDDCEQDEITWCQSRQFDTDVEYVRADISDELRKSRDHHASTIFIQGARIASQAAEIERLRAALERELKANRMLGDAYNAQAAEIERMNDELAVRRMPRDEIYEGLQNALASANAALSELDDALALIASQAAEIERLRKRIETMFAYQMPGAPTE